MKTARLAAFEILYTVIKENAYSNITLSHTLEDVDKKDRAFTTELVYGVIERKITLDYILERFLKGKTKPKVKILLYIGTYQLYFMNKVPVSAAVNESVKLAESVGCGYYKSLINAVLRAADADRMDLDSVHSLSVRFSCPEPLVNMWLKMYGEENTKTILEASLGKPPVYAVPNPLYVTPDELEYELLDEGVHCERDGDLVRIFATSDITGLPAFQRGLFHIEDKNAYECACAIGAEPGDTVMDLCAAPGGKSFTIAERMHNQGKVYAFDLYAHRVRLMAEGVKRLGLSIIDVRVNNALEPVPDLPQADCVICDVPCSGFGIIRRKPEIKYKNLDSVKELPETQLSILDAGSGYVKYGGRLLYATCTLNKKENEKVVARFLENHPGFCLINEKTLFPEKDGGDGFYYAVMEKHEGH